MTSFSNFLYLFLGILVIFYISKFIRFVFHYINLRYFFPGPIPLSFFGHGIVDFGEEDLKKLESYVEKYPRMHRIIYGPIIRILIASPELISQIYTQVPAKDRLFMDTVIPLLGNGLIMSSGDIWKRNRRLLTPLFHFKCLEGFSSVFNKAGDHFVVVLKAFTDCTFEFNRLARLATFESTMNSICSKDCDLQNNLHLYPIESKFLVSLDLFAQQLLSRFKNYLYFVDRIYYSSQSGKQYLDNCKEIRNLMMTYLHERRQEQTDFHREHNDLLDLIMKSRCEDGTGLSDEEMIDELTNFFVAGFDTTTCGISFLMYCLCRYPEWQEKCREEIMRVLGDCQFVTLRELPQFSLLTMCLKESLRLYSPATLVQRVVDKPVNLDGYILPKGTGIDIGIQSVHLNPTVWKDPFKFDPYRFEKENMETKHPYSFIPFSAGPRNCVGQQFALTEMKILIIKLLKSYKFSLSPGYRMIRETSTVLTQKGGLTLTIIPVE